MLAIYSYLTFILFPLLFVLPSQTMAYFPFSLSLFFSPFLYEFTSVLFTFYSYTMCYFVCCIRSISFSLSSHLSFSRLFFFFSLCRRCASVYFFAGIRHNIPSIRKTISDILETNCCPYNLHTVFYVWILCHIDKVQTRV